MPVDLDKYNEYKAAEKRRGDEWLAERIKEQTLRDEEQARKTQTMTAELEKLGATTKEIESIVGRYSFSYMETVTASDAALALKNRREEEREKAIEMVAAKRKRLLKAGAPEYHLKHVYDVEPVDCQALREVREWVKLDTEFLLLLGGLGTFKTGSAVYAMTEIDDAVFASAEELPLLGGFDDEQQKRFKRLKECELLILDDLATEYQDAKGWSLAAFNSLMNARYSQDRKTIITANLTSARLKEIYGERAAERIRESGRIVSIEGASKRKPRTPVPRGQHRDNTVRAVGRAKPAEHNAVSEDATDKL